MISQFRNLVFEGGGVKGIAYIGAMKVMSEKGYLNNIERVGGTSVGAINALLYSLGYSIDEQKEILNSTDFKSFMDDSFGIIRDAIRLKKDYGWYKSNFVKGWIGDIIKNKIGNSAATFKDFKNHNCLDLYVIGTNLSTGYAEIFSRERFEDMPVAEAVRISMSVPIFFTAVRYGSPREDLYVDGGVVLNYPIKLFDREKYIDMKNEHKAARKVDYYDNENKVFLKNSYNKSPYVYNRQTLGFRLDSEEEVALFRYNEPLKGKQINNFIDYIKALVKALMQAQENLHLHSDDWQRTLYINTLDVSAMDFNLNDETKALLVEQGIKGAENYLEWFENTEENPVNKIS